MLATRRAALGAAVSLALLLGACSSSGGDDDAADETTTTEAEETTTTEAEETTTTEAEGDEDAQARAESIRLELEDFGEGWTSQPGAGDDEPSPLAECAPVLGDDESYVARHSSDEFTRGSFDAGAGSAVTASSRIFVDEASAEAALEPFSDAEDIACFDELLKAQYASGGASVEGTMIESDPGPASDLGLDQVEGISAEYALSAPDGSSAEVLLAVLALRQGDAGALVVINAVGDDLQLADVEPAILAIAGRLAEA